MWAVGWAMPAIFSHAPARGNAVGDDRRHGTQSVPVGVPTETVGTRSITYLFAERAV